MIKCKWAGDPNDEYCKNCNGENLMFEGQERIASDCAGYEEGTEEVDTTAEPIMNEPVKEEVQVENEAVKETPKKEHKQKKPTQEKVEAEPVISVTVDENPVSKVKSIRIMSGVTKEIDGVYYKFTYEQENEINADATSSQVEKERARLWEIANNEVDKQLLDIINN